MTLSAPSLNFRRRSRVSPPRTLGVALSLFAVVVWTVHTVGLVHRIEPVGCENHCQCLSPVPQSEPPTPEEGSDTGREARHCPICLLVHGGKGVVGPESVPGAHFLPSSWADALQWIDTFDFHKRHPLRNEAPLRGPPPAL